MLELGFWSFDDGIRPPKNPNAVQPKHSTAATGVIYHSYMPRFNYVALDSRGQESTGLVEAGSPNEVIGQLRQAGYFPTSVLEEGKAGADGTAAKRATARRPAKRPAAAVPSISQP